MNPAWISQHADTWFFESPLLAPATSLDPKAPAGACPDCRGRGVITDRERAFAFPNDYAIACGVALAEYDDGRCGSGLA
jgi:hypothetical protein